MDASDTWPFGYRLIFPSPLPPSDRAAKAGFVYDRRSASSFYTRTMTRRFLLFAFAAFAATTAAACGGDDADTITGPSPTGTAPFSITDLVVGNGATANAGQAVTVTY